MNGPSFRTRLMLFSVGVSGVALLAFASWSYARLYDAGLDRVDNELRDLGERHLFLPPEQGQWEEVERSLGLLFGTDRDEAVLMLVKGRDGGIVRVSPYWPMGLSTDRFPAPEWEGEIRTSGPPPEHRPPSAPPPPRRESPGFEQRQRLDDADYRRPPPEGRYDGRRSPPPGGQYGGPPPGEPFGGPPPRGDSPPPGGLAQPTPYPRPDGPPPQLPGIGERSDSPNAPLARSEQDALNERPERAPGPERLRGGRPDEMNRRLPMRTSEFFTYASKEGTWRVGVMGNPHATLALGVPLGGFYADMRDVRNAFLLAGALALAFILAGAWWLADRAIRPVRVLSGAVEQVSARGLDKRVPVTGQAPEFERLAEQFNAMMGRLEISFGQAVRFSADAAHELKTPLTILQGQLEEALRKEPAGSPHQAAYSELLEEVQRLKTIVRKLLLLSRADAGQLTLTTVPVDLSAALEEIVEDTRILGKSLDVSAEIEPGIWAPADEALLKQLLQNLASNAVKYNVKKGRIRFLLRRHNGHAVLSVWNTGAPLAEADRERIFDRFYRVDASRNRRIGGAGLGLSLAREIARAHNGNLTLESPKEHWIGFRLTLPTSGV